MNCCLKCGKSMTWDWAHECGVEVSPTSEPSPTSDQYHPLLGTRCPKCGEPWSLSHDCPMSSGKSTIPYTPPPSTGGANATQEGGSHYKEMGVEPWDVIDTWPLDQRIGAYRAGALKYIMRMGSKDQHAQEIKKARHYCEKLVEVLTEALSDARKED